MRTVVVILVSPAATTLLAVLPVYVPPVVLRGDDVPPILMVMAVVALAGAVLGVAVSGIRRGVALVLACSVAGAFLRLAYATSPTYEPGVAPYALWYVLLTFSYVALPALGGVVVSGSIRALVTRRQNRGRVSRV